MKCLVIGSGEIKDYKWLTNSINIYEYIICSDGGLIHCDKINRVPNLIVGDFDSVPTILMEKYKNKNVEIKSFPPEKDYTDMELALDYGIDKGYEEIHIIGGIGSRFDHTFGNLHLLIKLLKKNIIGKLINENNIVMVINKDTVIKKLKKYISIIPITDNLVVSTKGLKYPLDNSKMLFGETRGISNEFFENSCEVIVLSGLACIFQSDY